MIITRLGRFRADLVVIHLILCPRTTFNNDKDKKWRIRIKTIIMMIVMIIIIPIIIMIIMMFVTCNARMSASSRRSKFGSQRPWTYGSGATHVSDPLSLLEKNV